MTLNQWIGEVVGFLSPESPLFFFLMGKSIWFPWFHFNKTTMPLDSWSSPQQKSPAIIPWFKPPGFSGETHETSIEINRRCTLGLAGWQSVDLHLGHLAGREGWTMAIWVHLYHTYVMTIWYDNTIWLITCNDNPWLFKGHWLILCDFIIVIDCCFMLFIGYLGPFIQYLCHIYIIWLVAWYVCVYIYIYRDR